MGPFKNYVTLQGVGKDTHSVTQCDKGERGVNHCVMSHMPFNLYSACYHVVLFCLHCTIEQTYAHSRYIFTAAGSASQPAKMHTPAAAKQSCAI